MKEFFKELKRRNVIKAAIAYLVAAWLILQVISTVLPPLGTPDWVIRMFTVLIIIGFPFWLVFSWVYEVTEEGLKRTSSVKEEETIRPVTNKRLNIMIVVLLIVAIGLNIMNSGASVFNGFSSTSDEIYEASIAVIPFDDISSQGDSEWFCVGIADDILTHLALISDMKVISRTSTERYKDTDKGVPEIAKELDVNYLVEGSVSVHEGEFMLNVQLIDHNDQHVWAEIFRGEYKDIFEVREDISKQIANKLKVALSPEEEKALESTPTTNIRAYELVMKAKTLMDQDAVANRKQTEKLLSQAIALDSNYADAYGYMAYNVMMNGPSYGIEGEKVFFENNAKALKLDPDNMIGLLNKAGEAWFSRDFDEAKHWLDKASDVNANQPTVHMFLSFHYSMPGNEDWEKALYHSRKAHELDPFSIEVTRGHYQTLNMAGRYTEAEEVLENGYTGWSQDEEWWIKTWWKGVAMNDKAYVGRKLIERIEMDPANANLYRELARYYDGVLNNNEKYLEYTRKAFEMDPGNQDIMQEYLQAMAENRAEEQFFAVMDTLDFEEYDLAPENRNVWLNSIYYQTGQYEKAITALDELPAEIFHLPRLLSLLRLDEKEKVEAHIKKFRLFMEPRHWAAYYALKENRDSLYYYLNLREINASWVNSRVEFDQYREEDRYKAFLRKHGFPLREDYKEIDLELKLNQSIE